MQAASDAVIWDHALASTSAIDTKEEDFAQRKVLPIKGRPWFGSGCRTRGGETCSHEAMLPDALAALARGETLIENT